MRRSRKNKRGGDPTDPTKPTIPIPVSAINALAKTATQLAGELGNLIPSVPAVQSDLSATSNAGSDQPSNAAVQSPNSEASSLNPGVDPNAVQPNDSAGTSAAVVQPNNAGSDQPSNAATSEPASLLTPETPIPYGNGSNSILYGKIATILNNMITNPANYNKKNIPEQQLQTLLTQIQSAKTVVEVSNILRANGIAPVGNGSKQYFSMNMTGGTKKRKRTKMTTRRKTRKLRKTTKTMKI
jgi:hypothetical protein